MLLKELKEIKSYKDVEALTKNLGQKTNKYRELKTPGALRGIQKAEDKIERELGQK